MKKPILYMTAAAAGLALLQTPLQTKAAPCQPQVSVIRICPGSVTFPDTDSLDVNSLLERLGITGCVQLPDSTVPECTTPECATPQEIYNVWDLLERFRPEQLPPRLHQPAQPEAEQPVAEQPVIEQPVVEQPVVEQPVAEQPVAEQPEVSYHEYVLRIVSLVNEERAKAGLQPVTLSRSVTNVAQLRAQETVTLFSHTRPNGTSCFTALAEAGINYRGAGENIAYGQRSPEEVMNGWMNSSGHRANILNASFTTIGVGYYQAANGVKYWSQMFTY